MGCARFDEGSFLQVLLMTPTIQSASHSEPLTIESEFGPRAHPYCSVEGEIVDWKAVVQETPQNVNAWLLWIHSKRSPEVGCLLGAMRESLPRETGLALEPAQLATWKAYLKTRLPCNLMKILMDRSLLSHNSASVSLILYHFCLHQCRTY